MCVFFAISRTNCIYAMKTSIESDLKASCKTRFTNEFKNGAVHIQETVLSFLSMDINCCTQAKWFESSLLCLQVLQHICTLTCLLMHNLLCIHQLPVSLSYWEQMWVPCWRQNSKNTGCDTWESFNLQSYQKDSQLWYSDTFPAEVVLAAPPDAFGPVSYPSLLRKERGSLRQLYVLR